MDDPNKLIRVQIDLPKRRVDLVDELMESTGTRNRREFIDQAVLFLAWAIKQRRDGRIIGAINPDEGGYNEVLLPILADAVSNDYEPKASPKKGPGREAPPGQTSHPATELAIV